ncbi:MAG: crossover junction endodeoxyribonuclease RuvC [Bacillota bacterium]
MVILGIDPGTATTGFGIIEKKGSSYAIVNYGVIKTSADLQLKDRLLLIYQDLCKLIAVYHPDSCAIEELFFNKNTRTALNVGQARGVALLAMAETGLPVGEYTPLQVKQAIVGYGRADKHQVQYMVKLLLNMTGLPKPDDAADALAVALCHGQSCGRFSELIRMSGGSKK